MHIPSEFGCYNLGIEIIPSTNRWLARVQFCALSDSFCRHAVYQICLEVTPCESMVVTIEQHWY